MVALYVYAPEEDGEWAPGGASRWWLHHSLARLDESLRARGGQLTFRRGGSLEALLDVARESGAERVHWNRLYDPARVAQDTRIKAALREAGLECESFNAALLHEPWEVRTGQGDPAKALYGLQFWTWDTREVLDMILWMRAYNADAAHDVPLRRVYDAALMALAAWKR